jgi:hypothetical protein
MLRGFVLSESAQLVCPFAMDRFDLVREFTHKGDGLGGKIVGVSRKRLEESLEALALREWRLLLALVFFPFVSDLIWPPTLRRSGQALMGVTLRGVNATERRLEAEGTRAVRAMDHVKPLDLARVHVAAKVRNGLSVLVI